MSLATMIRLWWARTRREGLRRERARLHQLRAGIEWELARNTRDMTAAQAALAHLEEYRRQQKFARRFVMRGRA